MSGQYAPRRRTCGACHRVFTCDSAFHIHIVGRRAQAHTLRCRTDEELRRIGMDQYEDGAWHSRISQAHKEPDGPASGRRRPFA